MASQQNEISFSFPTAFLSRCAFFYSRRSTYRQHTIFFFHFLHHHYYDFFSFLFTSVLPIQSTMIADVMYDAERVSPSVLRGMGVSVRARPINEIVS